MKTYTGGTRRKHADEQWDIMKLLGQITSSCKLVNVLKAKISRTTLAPIQHALQKSLFRKSLPARQTLDFEFDTSWSRTQPVQVL